MNVTNVKNYKQILKDICNKYPGSEEYISGKTEEICFHQKLSAGEVAHF